MRLLQLVQRALQLGAQLHRLPQSRHLLQRAPPRALSRLHRRLVVLVSGLDEGPAFDINFSHRVRAHLEISFRLRK